MKQIIIENYRLILGIYAVINLLVFLLYGIDKRKAVKDRWRISEKTLLISAVFGVIGAIIGMLTFSHKIRKPRFFITVPLILILELVLVYLLIRD